MKGTLAKFKNVLYSYAKENMLALVFVLSSVINAFLLRAFTVKFNYNQIKPLLADIGMCLIFAAISMLFKKRKGQFVFLLVLTIIFAIISAGNSIYYTNFRSFMSISLISTASQLGGVMDAVTKEYHGAQGSAVPVVYTGVDSLLYNDKKETKDYTSQEQEKKHRSKIGWATFGLGVGFSACVRLILTGTDYSRLENSGTESM